MEGAPVPHRPGNQRKQHANRGNSNRKNRHEHRAARAASSLCHPEHRRDNYRGKQSLLRPQQDRVGHRDCRHPQPAVESHPGTLPPLQTIERQRNGEESQNFRERSSRVGCRKRAQRREPERGNRGPPSEQPVRKSRDQNAGPQVDRALNVHHRGIVLDAEETKARHQKQRITRQPDQRRCGDTRRGEPVDTMFHPVPRNVAVKQRIAIDTSRMGNEPQTQDKAGRERKRGVEACLELSSDHVFAS